MKFLLSDSGATTLFENIGNGEIKGSFYYAIKDYTEKMFQIFSNGFIVLPVIMTVKSDYIYEKKETLSKIFSHAFNLRQIP